MSEQIEFATLARVIYYEGRRVRGGVAVSRHERPDASNSGARDLSDSVAELPLRLDLADHSPAGFEWGYGGSGPAQLALALLADALDDEYKALTLYQAYKQEVIAHLPQKEWQLTEQEVTEAARRLSNAAVDAWPEQ